MEIIKKKNKKKKQFSRLEAVQFSQPISDSGIVVIVKKGGKHDLKSLIEDGNIIYHRAA